MSWPLVIITTHALRKKLCGIWPTDRHVYRQMGPFIPCSQNIYYFSKEIKSSIAWCQPAHGCEAGDPADKTKEKPNNVLGKEEEPRTVPKQMC